MKKNLFTLTISALFFLSAQAQVIETVSAATKPETTLSAPPASLSLSYLAKQAADYYSGVNGVNQDYAKAFEIYSRISVYAPKFSYFAAKMSEEGVGTEKNMQRAMALYQIAAEMGNSDAQNRLGEIYQDGLSGERNEVLAHVWFSIAAKDYRSALKKRNDLRAKLSSDEVAESVNLIQTYTSKIESFNAKNEKVN